MADKKISKFVLDPTVSDTDEFTFVANNTNFKTTFADIKTSLGVTGTLTSIGDASGIDILNQPAPTTNEIRKVIGAKGVLAALSSGDGVSIEGNFLNGSGGASIIQSLTSDATTFRSIVGSSGINVSASGDQIQVALSTTPPAVNTVIIVQESDFPTQDATSITLDDNTGYLISGSFSTAKTIIGNGSRLFSNVAGTLASITYTGTGSLFATTNSRFTIDNITINCPNGKVFTITGDGTENFEFRMTLTNIVCLNCVNIGEVINAGVLFIDVANFQNVTGTFGVRFSGTGGVAWVISRVAIAGLLPGAIGIDLGSATTRAIQIVEVFYFGDSAAIAISGLIDNGNILINQLGIILGCNFQSFTNPLQNITSKDSRWRLLNNAGVGDSVTDCLLSFQTPTVTTLAVDTPTLINGTWVVERESQMSGTTSGRATSNIETVVDLPITLTISVEPVSGTNIGINVYIAKNGTEITNSRVPTIASSGSPQNLTAVWQDDLLFSGFFEVFIENVTNSTNIQVNSATLKVN